jgi:hypothetical protein
LDENMANITNFDIESPFAQSFNGFKSSMFRTREKEQVEDFTTKVVEEIL